MSKRFGYLLLPDEQAERVDLTATHKLVLMVLARVQGLSAFCYPSLEYIGKACGMSRRQVIRIVADLERRKEIVLLRHHRRANTYSVPWATARNLRRKWAEEREAKGPRTG